MFCSSLRKRREWTQVPSSLLSQQQPRWKGLLNQKIQSEDSLLTTNLEQSLETHDLALPLPQRHSQNQQEWFRLLLISPSDMEPALSHMARIERLYHQTGGLHVGIVFLLRDHSSQGDGTNHFMALQLRCAPFVQRSWANNCNVTWTSLLTTFEMPIVPISSVSALQQSVSSFQRQLVQTRFATSPQINPSVALLPYCSVDGRMPEHTRNVLSDICHSIPELAEAATTRSGQDVLRQWLSEPSSAVAEHIIEFWKQEYIVE